MDEYGKDYGKNHGRDYGRDYDNGCTLEKVLERFKGQPVEILTTDGVRYCGIELSVGGNGVEIIDKCSRVIFLPYRHIDAVVEPKMKLTPFCGDKDCDCRHDDCHA